MYTETDRERYFQDVIIKIQAINEVEGIIQLGSGTIGYSDQFSDIDLMVATIEQVDVAKDLIKTELQNLGSFFIKEGKFSDQIFLLIPFYENGLEMNISVLPTSFLNVKSPLWKLIFDRNGEVLPKMLEEHENFQKLEQPYIKKFDIVFEFAYHLRKLHIEHQRGNDIFAMEMLEELREFTLTVQILNEQKKLHQFKAYHTLEEDFVKQLKRSYPSTTDSSDIMAAAKLVTQLFKDTIQKNEIFDFDEQLFKIAEI
ncbi:hypothetical protein [Solibacillus sp. FSL K6-4121]|uniref:hypothetical protein n=1 Tax=Solibacillus sp. FSL K6-4121 TaxID=2921505 RepID=UPI0030FA48F8